MIIIISHSRVIINHHLWSKHACLLSLLFSIDIDYRNHRFIYCSMYFVILFLDTISVWWPGQVLNSQNYKYILIYLLVKKRVVTVFEVWLKKNYHLNSISQACTWLRGLCECIPKKKWTRCSEGWACFAHQNSFVRHLHHII